MILRAISENIEVRKGASDLERQFIISTERKDSHGTIIKMDGWDIADFNRSGAFYYQHLTNGGFLTDSNPDNALGPAVASIENKQLIGTAKFETGDINPLAEKILKKVDYGTMRSTSVGFMPMAGNWGVEKNAEDPTAYYFTKQRLLEFSIVHIPSNPDAIKKAFESFDNYMMKKVEEHESKGYKIDYRMNLNKIRNERNRLLGIAFKRGLI